MSLNCNRICRPDRVFVVRLAVGLFKYAKANLCVYVWLSPFYAAAAQRFFFSLLLIFGSHRTSYNTNEQWNAHDP